MKTNGFLNAILPSILITLSIGSVYAFSFFSNDIATYIGSNLGNVQFAFSLSIFFLGMGAAFFGPLVERNINKAAGLSTLFYIVGMIFTTLGINFKFLPLIFIGYGLFNGLGQGIGYISPVKNLMLWFPKRKGLVSAISIVSFGLGSSLCVFLSKMIMPIVGIQYVFLCLGIVYFIMMSLGSLLLKKPNVYDRIGSSILPEFKYSSMFKDLTFWQSWTFMFLNISCGLALIGASKNIFNEVVSKESLIVVLLMLCGLFNGSFRLVFAWASDYLNKRINIWLIITVLSVLFAAISVMYYPFIAIAILLLNATYGGGFSTLPSMLSDIYGNTAISRIHGLVLSAWGIAALPAYFLNSYVFRFLDSFKLAIVVIMFVYVLNMINVYVLKRRLG